MEYKYLPDISENIDSCRKPITAKDRIEGDIPYYGASGVVDHVRDYIFDEELLLVSEDGANLVMRSTPIAFSITGKAWVNNHAHVLRFKDKMLQVFVEYYLNHIDLSPYISGSAQPKLNQQMLNAIPVPVPSSEIIEKTVAILDRIVSIKKQREKELLELDNLIKARFVEMFGEGLADDGKYPLIPISEIGKVVSGATPKTSIDEYWDGDNLWITPAEISDDTFVVSDTVRKITDEGVKSCAVNLLPIGTVILSSRAPIGKVAIAGAPMYCNQGFKNIIPNGKIDSVYLYELLAMETEYLNSLGRGATFKEISKQIVENIRIKVPPIEIQRDFSNFVKHVDKSKSAVQKSLDEAQFLFDSLMQKYFG